MKYLSFKMVFLINIFLFSCARTNSNQKYEIILSDYPNMEGYEFYLLLPKDPCWSCISSTYEFVKLIDSLKISSVRIFLLDDEISLAQDGICDGIIKKNRNVVVFPDFHSESKAQIIYPTIFYMNGNRIRHIEIQNAQNPYALKTLSGIIFKNYKLYEKCS